MSAIQPPWGVCPVSFEFKPDSFPVGMLQETVEAGS